MVSDLFKDQILKFPYTWNFWIIICRMCLWHENICQDSGEPPVTAFICGVIKFSAQWEEKISNSKG